MNISDIQPTRAFVLGPKECCQCNQLGNNVEVLVEMRLNVDGQVEKFHIHLACLMKLAGDAARGYWDTITLGRCRAQERRERMEQEEERRRIN